MHIPMPSMCQAFCTPLTPQTSDGVDLQACKLPFAESAAHTPTAGRVGVSVETSQTGGESKTHSSRNRKAIY